MRDNPYPSRFYTRQVDQPFLSTIVQPVAQDRDSFAFQNPLPQLLFILMMLYLICALFLIFAVTSYAGSLGNATITSAIATSHVATTCVDTACVNVATFATR